MTIDYEIKKLNDRIDSIIELSIRLGWLVNSSDTHNSVLQVYSSAQKPLNGIILTKKTSIADNFSNEEIIVIGHFLRNMIKFFSYKNPKESGVNSFFKSMYKNKTYKMTEGKLKLPIAGKAKALDIFHGIVLSDYALITDVNNRKHLVNIMHTFVSNNAYMRFHDGDSSTRTSQFSAHPKPKERRNAEDFLNSATYDYAYNVNRCLHMLIEIDKNHGIRNLGANELELYINAYNVNNVSLNFFNEKYDEWYTNNKCLKSIFDNIKLIEEKES